MENNRRITTPIIQRWHHFRTGLLPLLFFIATIWVIMNLWERRATQGHIVAEAEHSAVDVASGADGHLIELQINPDGWEIWDRVTKGDVIARLDSSLLEQEIEVAKGETERMKAELEATRLRSQVDLKAIGQGYKRDTFERIFQAYDLELEKRRIQVTLAEDEKASNQVSDQLAILKRAGDASPEANRIELQNQINVINARIQENGYLLVEIEKQLKEAGELAKNYTDQELDLPDVTSMKENLDSAIRAQDSQIKLIRMKIKKMTIQAPVSGVISEIFKRPGEAIARDEPVIRIASDDSEFVIGYWRDRNNTRPRPGMKVGVRLPQPNGVEYEQTIVEVGPQYAAVPLNQLTDFSRPEFGVPVKIEIPQAHKRHLVPGELVHVIYRGESTSNTESR